MKDNRELINEKQRHICFFPSLYKGFGARISSGGNMLGRALGRSIFRSDSGVYLSTNTYGVSNNN